MCALLTERERERDGGRDLWDEREEEREGEGSGRLLE